MDKHLTAGQRTKAAIIGVGLGIAGDRQGSNFLLRAAFTGQWEGSEQSRVRNRPGKRTASQDTDLNYGVRELLISDARQLEQNFPITRRIRNKYPDYCVGKCRVKWRTGDAEVDKKYQANWESFMTRADVNGIHTFPKLTKLAVGATIGEGDIFGQLVDSDGYLQIRCIEADRVSSSGVFNADTKEMVGGIGLFPNGRPKFIRVWDRTIYGMFENPQEIQKPNWVHLFDSKRVDGMRSVTAYHAILNQLRDFKETSAAEQAALKRNSKLALIHKVVSGQAPQVNLFEGQAAPDSPAGITMREVNDSAEEYIYTGEDIQAHRSERPGANWIPMMEFIIRQIAIGVDLPFGVLWHWAGMGKPAILADLQAAQRTFSAFMDELEWKWMRPIIGVETAKAQKAGRLPFHPNWWQFQVGRPAPITIDAGRDSIAGLNENRAAMRSARSWFFETEEDWEEETEQCFVEEAFRQQMEIKHKVKKSDVRVLGPNVLPEAPPDKTQKPQLQTEEVE